MKVGDLVCYAQRWRERTCRVHGIALEVDDSSSPPVITVLWNATPWRPTETGRAYADQLEVISESR